MRIEHYLSILQACTGIEDFGIALHHLEEANWVLMVSFLKSGLKVDLKKPLKFNSYRMKEVVSLSCLPCSQDAVNRAIPQDGGGGVDPVADGGGSPPRIVSLHFVLRQK